MTATSEKPIDVSAKILAKVLHEIAPNVTESDWEKHVRETAHDPAKFFGTNTQGREEYEQFVRRYDKDKYRTVLNRRERRAMGRK